MAIGDREFSQVMQAQDEGTLGSIYNFSTTGKQDDSNNRLRELINKRVAEIRAEQERKALQNQLTNQAKDYRTNMKGEQEKQFSQVADTGRQQLAQQMAGIRAGANKRGLLYGGQRAGAEASAQAQTASNLGAQRAQINQGTEQIATTMEQQAAQAGLQSAQQRQEQLNDSYNKALKKQQEQSAASGALGSALGGGFGSFMGSKAKG